jgi:hypothetical protein
MREMSALGGIIEHMFDDIPDPATCGKFTPDEMVSAIRACHRTGNPGLTMPTRTRARARAHHIKTERAYNAAQRALENTNDERPPPTS